MDKKNLMRRSAIRAGFAISLLGLGGASLAASYQFRVSSPLLVASTESAPVVLGEDLVTGSSHTLVKASDGSWYGTGNNSNGGLGLGDTADRTAFTKIASLPNAVKVSAGSSHTLALTADGTLYAAGLNTSGQLGLGDKTQRNVFTQVTALSNVVDVIAGRAYSFAKKADGTWWAVGANSDGQLGLGDTIARPAWVQVPALTNATQVILGLGTHVIARMPDGSWYGTGQNVDGQLGLGDLVNRTSFTRIPGLDGATAVVLGYRHTMALYSDGRVGGAGYNYSGQLGIGNTTSQSSFVKASTITDATGVAVGFYTSFVQRAGSAWWAAGANSEGQYGRGNTTSVTSFAQVTNLNGVPKVLPHNGHSTFARRADGSWMGTGFNASGELGLGHTAKVTSFTLLTIP